MITANIADKVLQLLAAVAETDEVFANLDLPLYDQQVLDSMKTVELMVALEQQFGVKVSPAEFEREQWRSPRKIIADVERRLRP
jgi:D-alanine--poly(phosphoribitol) ligase subunit 2